MFRFINEAICLGERFSTAQERACTVELKGMDMHVHREICRFCHTALSIHTLKFAPCETM
jgi:hypothetical protein